MHINPIQVVILVVTWCTLARATNITSCPDAYRHCNLGKEGYINVHIVPHTHDDMGWVKTVDEYFYGLDNSTWEKSVFNIISND